MIINDFLDSLIGIIFLLKDDEGHARLDNVLNQLNKRGLLNTFADEDISFKEILDSDEAKRLITKGVAVMDADDTDEDGPKQSEVFEYLKLTEEGLKEVQSLTSAKYSNPASLFTWGFMAGFDKKLEQLADMAIPENWSEPGQHLSILRAYLTNTFRRLLHMRKEGQKYAIIEGEKWAAFNTGLIDKLYDPIFALFTLNKKQGMQKWVFHSWCTPGHHRAGQILSRFFERLPIKARYFDKPSEIIYDLNAGIPTLPFEHIVERIQRIPLSFLKKMAPEGFDWPEESFTADDAFFQRLRDAFASDDYASLRLKDALELSLRRAIKKVGWNYRLVIPVYDTKRRRMMLLIPMSLDFEDNNKTDIALMVERAQMSGKYIGHTIITPAMAYRKARMVMSPISDWLPQSLLEEQVATPMISEEDTELENEIKTLEADADAALLADKARQEADEKTYVDADEDGNLLYHHEKLSANNIYRPEGNLGEVKVLGKIDVSKYDKSFLFRKEDKPLDLDAIEAEDDKPEESQFTPTYEIPKPQPRKQSIAEILATRDYDIPGIYKSNYGNPYILVGIYRYQAREFTDKDLYDDDDVIFDIKEEPNRKNTGIFRYAVNIRLAD